MIKLSRMADYAVMIMTHISVITYKSGKVEPVLISAHDLANATGLSDSTVSKVLKLLTKGKLLVSERGANGGYKLIKPASQISVASIVESVDGPIALTDCLTDSRSLCAVEHNCGTKTGWMRINEGVRNAFTAVSLEDMTHDECWNNKMVGESI